MRNTAKRKYPGNRRTTKSVQENGLFNEASESPELEANVGVSGSAQQQTV